MPDQATDQPTDPTDLEERMAEVLRLLGEGPGGADSLRSAAAALAEAVAAAAAYRNATTREALALSRGELKARIQSRGPAANALRSIQSTLRHLSYQAGAVADGDLSIEIYGLGPLGEAFNRMAQQLRENRDAIEAKNAQLAERNAALEEAYGIIDHQFRVVGDIQVSLLPERPPDIVGFDVATHYRAATRAGGDYFDYFPLDDGRWGVMVADVSGHGAPAAVVMAMTRVILHIVHEAWSGAADAPSREPAPILARLNQELCENILSGMFVTCCYGVLDPAARTFTYASAGHPPPVVLEADSHRAAAQDAEGSFPLGIVEGAEYETAVLALPPGTGLVIYTDGITEAFNDAQEQFGETRLMEAVSAADPAASAIRDAILHALDAYRGPVELADDTTLVVLHSLAE